VVASVVASTLGLGLPTTASVEDLEAQLAEARLEEAALQVERVRLQEELDETSTRLDVATIELIEVQAKLPVAQAELEIAEADLADAQAEADYLAERLVDATGQEVQVSKEIEATAEEVTAARADVVGMARAAQRRPGDLNPLGMIAEARSAQELMANHAANSSASRARTRTLTQLQNTQAMAVNQRDRLEAVQETIAQLHAAAEENVQRAAAAERVAIDHRNDVRALINTHQTLTNEILAEQAQLELTMTELDEAYAQTQQEVAALVGQRDAAIEERRRQEEERRRQEEERLRQEREQQQQQSNSSESNTTSSAQPPPATGNFLGWPVANPHVTSHFGMRWHPVFGGMRMHNGTDFRAPCGTPIFASQSGYVVTSAYNWHNGHHIVIDHGQSGGQNISTLYSKMQSRSVSVGQWVEQGQVIAHSGMTGISTGCHLHFEVFVGGSRVNPLSRLPG